MSVFNQLLTSGLKPYGIALGGILILVVLIMTSVNGMSPLKAKKLNQDIKV